MRGGHYNMKGGDVKGRGWAMKGGPCTEIIIVRSGGCNLKL